MNHSKTPEPQFYINAIVRGGNSGSPVVNEEGELVGIVPNGFNNSGTASDKFRKEEMAYAISLIDETLKEIKNNTY